MPPALIFGSTEADFCSPALTAVSYTHLREESHFENLPKSKYAPLPWKINDELNGGWSGFDKSKFQKVKDEGLSLIHIYCRR